MPSSKAKMCRSSIKRHVCLPHRRLLRQKGRCDITPEDRSFILQIIGLIIVAIVGYFTKKNGEELTKSREERNDLKQGLTAVSEKVSDVILKFDPLTQTLDGQLDKIKRTVEDLGNLKGRSELMAEQAATAAIVANAVAGATAPTAANPASQPTAANPLLTEDIARELMDKQTVIADKGEGWEGEEPHPDGKTKL